jgi:proteasome lid subunit RPN8/RPN11
MTRRRPLRRRHTARQRPKRPPLRLTPYAWAKLLLLRDAGPTEVGGFGVSSNQDLLLVEDVQLVKQQCTPLTVCFDDPSVADYFDAQVDLGRKPEQFARIWIHTHPGSSPQPSATDEETFERCFGSADWAVMLIVARGGQTYARLRFGTGPGAQLVLPVEIDFQAPFPGSDQCLWEAHYRQLVTAQPERALARLDSRWGELPLSGDLCLEPSSWLSGADSDLIWEPVHAPF